MKTGRFVFITSVLAFQVYPKNVGAQDESQAFLHRGNESSDITSFQDKETPELGALREADFNPQLLIWTLSVAISI